MSEIKASEHATCSPSSAAGWFYCPQFENSPAGEAAERGTLCHEYAAAVLRNESSFVPNPAGVVFQNRNEYAEAKVLTPAERANAEVYINEVLSNCKGGELSPFVEVPVPIGSITGEVGARGTADLKLINRAQKRLTIVDYKSGHTPVQLTEPSGLPNLQLSMYLLGALFAENPAITFEDAKEWVLAIGVCQPHVHEEIQLRIVDAATLWPMLQQLRDAATLRLGGTAPAVPGESQCKYCVKKLTCKPLAEYAQKSVKWGEQMEAAGAEAPPSLIAALLDARQVVLRYFDAAESKAFELLKAGTEVPGYKLVRGKAGHRKWLNEAEVTQLLRKRFKLKQDQVFDATLRSPAAIEDLLTTAELKPAQWDQLKELVTQAPGGLSLARSNDRRPAVKLTATVDDFADLTQTQNEVPQPPASAADYL